MGEAADGVDMLYNVVLTYACAALLRRAVLAWFGFGCLRSGAHSVSRYGEAVSATATTQRLTCMHCAPFPTFPFLIGGISVLRAGFHGRWGTRLTPQMTRVQADMPPRLR